MSAALLLEAATSTITVADVQDFEIGSVIIVNGQDFKILEICGNNLIIYPQSRWYRLKDYVSYHAWYIALRIQSAYYRVEDWAISAAAEIKKLLEKK